jgi:predicted DNA-binding transcriptional regulator AlpA
MNNQQEMAVLLLDALGKAVERINQKEENLGIDLITDEELQKRLQVSRTTLYNWRKAGIIPYRRIGNKLRYSWKAVIDVFG